MAQAAVPVVVPNAGESITEGILARWIKPNGSFVQAGDDVCEIETDKTTNPAKANASGVLIWKAQEGDTVEIGATIGEIDTSAQPAAVAASPAKAESPTPTPAATPAPAAISANGDAPAPSMTPAGRRIAAETGVNPADVTATGRHGLVTKPDVIAHLASRAEAPSTPAASPPAASAFATGPVAATGPGRPREVRERMSGLRQKIAQRLVEAQQTAAILTTFNEADLSRVIELRAKYKETFQKKHGIGLGFMSFFIKAVVEALKTYPRVNGRIEGNEIVINQVYDIGVAVSTERGLMVPVIRDADQKGFANLEKELVAYATRARENKIDVADLQGGTFTITNGGVFGSLLSTPILNPPQSGILGMHTIQKRPVALDDQVVIRPMMYLALSYDHRIIDGREAVGFLVRVKECVENPERMLIEI